MAKIFFNMHTSKRSYSEHLVLINFINLASSSSILWNLYHLKHQRIQRSVWTSLLCGFPIVWWVVSSFYNLSVFQLKQWINCKTQVVGKRAS